MPEVSHAPAFKMNMPELFAREDFRVYLNDRNNNMATWHPHGEEPGEYSDVFIHYDNGEGSHSDMPGWDLVVAAMTKAGIKYGIVQITNLDD